MWRHDKGDMMNTVPNRQQATGWGINPTDLCPPITFIYFQQEVPNGCFGRPLQSLSNCKVYIFHQLALKVLKHMQTSLCCQQLTEGE